MKRCLILVLMFCVVSVGAGAATCIGGNEYEGKNGHTYCISNRGMNWWSAFQWCKAQGRHFATPSEVCDYDGDVWGSGSCSNLLVGREIADQWGWLNLGLDASRSLVILFGNKSLYSTATPNNKTMQNRAICY